MGTALLFSIDFEAVVVADRVMNFSSKVVLRALVKVEKAFRSTATDAERVETVIAALNDEIAWDRASLPKTLAASCCGLELRLQIRVSDEDEGEWLVRTRPARIAGTGCGRIAFYCGK